MGVESIEVDTVNIRMVARTLPGKQFQVGREPRARVAGAAPCGDCASRSFTDGWRPSAIVRDACRRGSTRRSANRSRNNAVLVQAEARRPLPRLDGGAHRRVRRVVLGAADLQPEPADRTVGSRGRRHPASCRTRTTPGYRARRCGGPGAGDHVHHDAYDDDPDRYDDAGPDDTTSETSPGPTTTVIDPDGPGGPLGPSTRCRHRR